MVVYVCIYFLSEKKLNKFFRGKNKDKKMIKPYFDKKDNKLIKKGTNFDYVDLLYDDNFPTSDYQKIEKKLK